jgi:translation initiation factor IF-2
MGIKISAPGLESAIAGSELFKCTTDAEVADAKEQIERDLVDILDKYVDKTQDGVCVQASTIGSLEALLEFLKQMGIPVTSVNIGPIHRRDVLKACTAKNNDKVKKEFATILAFDVRVMPDAQKFADEEDIKIFTANIIYHLFDEFTAYVQKCKDERKLEDGNKAIFPAIIEIVKDACFNTKSPIVIGVTVKEGVLRTGTPLCIPDKDKLRLGVVQSMELNKKPMNQVRAKDGSVAIKIINDGSVMYGRQFDYTSQIVSNITRDSIDLLKANYRDDMTKDDWVTVLKLKKILGIL